MTSTFTQLSDGLADAVATAGATVVSVHARRRIPATGILWEPGVVVTADHVIENEEEITVGLPDGSRVPATLAGRDPATEIAVLRIESTLAAATRRAGAVRVGSLVLAVGRAHEGLSASIGIVNSAGGRAAGRIRNDAPMYPGFSGGPLVDGEGAIAGMNTTGFGGASVTLPNDLIAGVVKALLTHGRVRKGYLGIGTQQARLTEAQATKGGLKQNSGLLIVAVEADSPAGKAGLLVGDILVRLGDAAIGEAGDLYNALNFNVGTQTNVTVLRGSEPTTLPVTIGERQ